MAMQGVFERLGELVEKHARTKKNLFEGTFLGWKVKKWRKKW